MAASEVQHNSASTTSGTTLTVTFSANVTAGNNVLVAVGTHQGTTNPTVSGITLGSTALVKANSLNNNSDTNSELWYLENAPSGQNTITITFNAGSGISPEMVAIASEWQGIAASASLDVHPAGGAGLGTTWSSNSSGTLSQASEVVFGVVFASGSGGTLTPPSSPWTNETLTAGLTELALGYQAVSATTALTYSGTSSATVKWSSVIASFKQTSNVSVALPVAQVTIAAPAPAPRTGPLALPVAQVLISALPVVPGQVVPLPVARVTVAALPPRLPVIIPTAQVTIAARPPQPAVNVSVALPAAAVTIAAHPPRVSRQLLISLAAKAGTDDYGTSFPQGLKATAGVIEGPTIIGSDAFYYSGGVPASGTLIASVAQAAGIDTAGNAYLAGTSTYGGTAPHLFATSLQGGSVQFWTASSEAGPWTFFGQIEIAPTVAGELVLDFTSISGAINTPQASGITSLPLTLPAPSSYSTVYTGDMADAVNKMWSALIAAGVLSS